MAECDAAVGFFHHSAWKSAELSLERLAKEEGSAKRKGKNFVLDVAVEHNQALCRYYANGLNSPFQFLKELSQISQKINQFRSSRGDNIDALNKTEAFAIYNRALIMTQLMMYSEAVSLLKSSQNKLSSVDKFLSFRASLLLLHIHLKENRPDAAQTLIESLEKQMDQFAPEIESAFSEQVQQSGDSLQPEMAGISLEANMAAESSLGEAAEESVAILLDDGQRNSSNSMGLLLAKKPDSQDNWSIREKPSTPSSLSKDNYISCRCLLNIFHSRLVLLRAQNVTGDDSQQLKLREAAALIEIAVRDAQSLRMNTAVSLPEGVPRPGSSTEPLSLSISSVLLPACLQFHLGNYESSIRMLNEIQMRSSDKSSTIPEGLLSALLFNNLGCAAHMDQKDTMASWAFSRAFKSMHKFETSEYRANRLPVTPGISSSLPQFACNYRDEMLYNTGLHLLTSGREPRMAFRSFYEAKDSFRESPLFWLRLAESCIAYELQRNDLNENTKKDVQLTKKSRENGWSAFQVCYDGARHPSGLELSTGWAVAPLLKVLENGDALPIPVPNRGGVEAIDVNGNPTGTDNLDPESLVLTSQRPTRTMVVANRVVLPSVEGDVVSGTPSAVTPGNDMPDPSWGLANLYLMTAISLSSLSTSPIKSAPKQKVPPGFAASPYGEPDIRAPPGFETGAKTTQPPPDSETSMVYMTSLCTLAFVQLSTENPIGALNTVKEIFKNLNLASKSQIYTAYIYYAEVLARVGDVVESEKKLSELQSKLESWSESEEVVPQAMSTLHANMAAVRLLQGKSTEARESIVTSLKVNHRFGPSMLTAAWMALKSGSIKPASELVMNRMRQSSPHTSTVECSHPQYPPYLQSKEVDKGSMDSLQSMPVGLGLGSGPFKGYKGPDKAVVSGSKVVRSGVWVSEDPPVVPALVEEIPSQPTETPSPAAPAAPPPKPVEPSAVSRSKSVPMGMSNQVSAPPGVYPPERPPPVQQQPHYPPPSMAHGQAPNTNMEMPYYVQRPLDPQPQQPLPPYQRQPQQPMPTNYYPQHPRPASRPSMGGNPAMFKYPPWEGGNENSGGGEYGHGQRQSTLW